MLPKTERLKERNLFNLAFKLGKTRNQKINSRLLSLYYLFSKKDINMLNIKLNIKTAFIVGLRVDKKATTRNLIKRRMKASYQFLKKTLFKNKRNISVFIWIANPPIKDATFEQIKDSMKNLLMRLDD